MTTQTVEPAWLQHQRTKRRHVWKVMSEGYLNLPVKSRCGYRTTIGMLSHSDEPKCRRCLKLLGTK